MWIRKLLLSLDRDLDSELKHVRAKTLGIAGPKVSIGAGDARIFKNGKLTSTPVVDEKKDSR